MSAASDAAGAASRRVVSVVVSRSDAHAAAEGVQTRECVRLLGVALDDVGLGDHGPGVADADALGPVFDDPVAPAKWNIDSPCTPDTAMARAARAPNPLREKARICGPFLCGAVLGSNQ